MDKLRKSKIGVLQKLMQGKISKDEAKQELEALKPLAEVVAIQDGDHFICGTDGAKGVSYHLMDTDIGPVQVMTNSQLDTMVIRKRKTHRVRSYVTITE